MSFKSMTALFCRTGIAAAALCAGISYAFAHDGQHPSGDNHLLGPGAWGDVKLVGKVAVNDAADDRVADVGALKTFAYLGAFAQENCDLNRENLGNDGGVYVIDIANPAAPKQVGFIPAHQDSYVGEGVHAISVTTSSYNGDLLLMNNESCGKNYKAGLSIWNITNPLKPFKLSENMGDFTAGDVQNQPHDANQIHSVFGWDAGSKAYAVIVDDDERLDVDIMDITNPRKPLLIAEYDARRMFNLSKDRGYGSEAFLHDMVVKQIGTKFYMLMSYWDAGWVVLDVTNPLAPVFIGETDYAAIDPMLLARTGKSLKPEGNGHQAEWTNDNKLMITTDEDFSPFRANFAIKTGPVTGNFDAGEFGYTQPISSTVLDGVLKGPVVFGGYGCPNSPEAIPDPSVLSPITGEKRILVLSRGPVGDPGASYDACFFTDKVDAAVAKGYDAVLIANHHEGADRGDEAGAILCGGSSGSVKQTMGVCISHQALHHLFGSTPNYAVPYPATGEPVVGQIGQRVEVTTTFDGWGYVHLYDAVTFQPLGQFAIKEAFKEANATNSGALSVHEVATDPTTNRAYLSYYAGGFRALKYSRAGLVETGGYLDPKGNDFWGVEIWKHPSTGKKYVLASDLDYGLYIFSVGQ